MNDHTGISSSGQGFVKLQRSETTKALLGDANGLHLLTVIAYRARWTDDESLDGLKFGQALIGDHEACGLTRKEYRCAMQRLARRGLASFEPVTRNGRRGTLATLLDGRVFVLRDERTRANGGNMRGQGRGQQASEVKSLDGANGGAELRADEGPVRGQSGATNQKERRKEGQNVLGASADASAGNVEAMVIELSAHPANAGLDVRREYERMALWCRTNRKQPTRRRFVAWLLRADRPLGGTRSVGSPSQLSEQFRKF